MRVIEDILMIFRVLLSLVLKGHVSTPTSQT